MEFLKIKQSGQAPKGDPTDQYSQGQAIEYFSLYAVLFCVFASLLTLSSLLPSLVSPFGPSFTSLRCYFNVQFSLNFNWVLSLSRGCHSTTTLRHHKKHQMKFFHSDEIYGAKISIKQMITHPTLPKNASM